MSRAEINREISKLRTSIKGLEMRQRFDDQQVHNAIKKAVRVTRQQLANNEKVVQLAIPLMDRGYTFKNACQAVREELEK